MSWSEAKENFQNLLNIQRANILHAKTERRRAHSKSLRQNNFFDPDTDLVIKQCNVLLKRIEESEQFLANLEAMKDCSPALTEEFLTEFLNSATSVIKNPEKPELYLELSKNLELLSKKDLEADKDIALKNAKFYFDVVYTMSFGLPLLICAVVVGATMGPLAAGLAALALVAAIVVIAISVQKMNKNFRFSKDSQKTEISAFVKDIAPSVAIKAQPHEALVVEDPQVNVPQ